MTSSTAIETDGKPETARWRKVARIAIPAVAVAVAVVIYALHWWTTGRFIEDTDDAYVGGEITVIGSKVPGYVRTVGVVDNQVVRQGDLLVTIDDRDYRAAVDKAAAAVAAAHALFSNLDATARLQRSVIAQATAGVASSKAESNRAQLDQARYSDLVGRSAVSIESAQRAEATWRTAQAANDRAVAVAQAADRQLDVIASQREQAQASLSQAQAELQIAKLNLSYTELRSPIDGVVGNRRARVGAYSAAGSQMLVVVPSHQLWVDANFKEDQMRRIRPGLAVDVRADVIPGRRFQGHIVSVAPATGAQFSVLPPENATGNFTKIVQRVPVRIALDGKDGDLDLLRPGLSVSAKVDTRP